MCRYLREVFSVEQEDEVNSKELFSKLKEFMDKEKTEYPTFALTSVIMDSFANGISLFKSTTNIVSSNNIQENFVNF